MRALAYVLMGFWGGMGLMVFFQDMGKNSSMLTPVSYAMAAPETENPKPWTSEDLLEMATIYDQQADELQSEVVRLEQRSTSLALKPHMDPKGSPDGLDAYRGITVESGERITGISHDAPGGRTAPTGI